MPLRLSLDPEIQALQKAVRTRIDALSGIVSEKKSGGVEIFSRDQIPFLQLEVRRDHLSIDLWLLDEQLEESRASGIARAHPFLGLDAIKIRFERAADLAKVSRWIEASYHYAPHREEHHKELEAKAAEEERLKAEEVPPPPKPLPIELEDKPKRPPPKPRRPGAIAALAEDEEPSALERRNRAERAKRESAPAAKAVKKAAKKTPKAAAKKTAKKPKAAAKPARRAAASGEPKARAKAGAKTQAARKAKPARKTAARKTGAAGKGKTAAARGARTKPGSRSASSRRKAPARR